MQNRDRRDRGLCVTCGQPAVPDETRNKNVNRLLARGGEPMHPQNSQTLERLSTQPYCAGCRYAHAEAKAKREKIRSDRRERSRNTHAHGTCHSCRNPRDGHHYHCKACKAKLTAAAEKLKAGREKDGLCHRCGKRPPQAGRKTCQVCLDRQNSWGRAWRARRIT